MGSIPFPPPPLTFSILLPNRKIRPEDWIGIFDGARTGARNERTKQFRQQIGKTYTVPKFPALAALAASGHHNRPQTSQQTHEMTVPNELIGCIIGKGGSKIAEIR